VKQRCLLALLLGILLPVSAHAETYRCVSLDYPPLIYKDADHRVKGFAVELVSAVFKNLGHNLQVEIYPWARSLEMARTGTRDCIFTIFQSPEREQFFDFSGESIIPQMVYFYTRKDTGVVFKGDFSSLEGLRIGTVRKISYGSKFDEARPRLQIDEAYELEQSMKKLLIGRIDVIPSNYYSAAYLLKLPRNKEMAEKIVQMPVAIDIVPSYLGFSKARKLGLLRDGFDREFRNFVSSGQYKDLLVKYQLESSPELVRFLQQKH